MTKYWVRMSMSDRDGADASRSSISMKLYGTVRDSDFFNIPPVAYREDGPVSDRFLQGNCYFTYNSDYYLGDIYQIEIANTMYKPYSSFPSPNIFIDKVFIRNPDPVDHTAKTDVVSCFLIDKWIDNKDEKYQFVVESGLDMETVKYMTEQMVYGTEFSVPPGATKSREISEQYETDLSDTVTTYRSTAKKVDISVKIKSSLFDLVSFGSSYTISNEEKNEETDVSSEKEDNIQLNTWKATITNDQDRVRTFKEAYIFRKNFSIVLLGNLQEEGTYRKERIFAGFMETTPV